MNVELIGRIPANSQPLWGEETQKFDLGENKPAPNLQVIFTSLYNKDLIPQNSYPLAALTCVGEAQKDNSSVEFSLFNLYETGGETVNVDPFLNQLKILQRRAFEKESILAISLSRGTLKIAEKIFEGLKAFDPKPILVLGGELPTHDSSHILKLTSDLPTVLIRQWGEETFRELVKRIVNNKPYQDLPNLAYLSEGKAIINPVIWPEDYPQVLVPDRDTLNRFYPRVEDSRGCPHNVCTYCSRPMKDSIIPDVWRPYDTDVVIRVVSALAQMGIKKFCLTGEEVVGIRRPEDPTTAERVQRFLELTRRVGELDMEFAASLRVQSIIALGVEGMKLARENGFQFPHVGIETLGNASVRIYGKATSTQENLKAFKILKEAGYERMELSFMLFHPLQTLSDLAQTIERIQEYNLAPHIGQIIQTMYVDATATYRRIVQKEEEKLGCQLLQPIDHNYLILSCKFLDPNVARLASISMTLRDFYHDAFATLHNVARQEFRKGKASWYYKIFIEETNDFVFKAVDLVNKRAVINNECFEELKIFAGQKMKRLTLLFEQVTSDPEMPQWAVDDMKSYLRKMRDFSLESVYNEWVERFI